MKRTFSYKLLIISALMSTAASPAHAGISDLINDFFTFREDQKPLVAPRKELPPVIVITPNYNKKEASKWSRYYTRDDLTPQVYIDSSSRVMRPGIAQKHAKSMSEQSSVTSFSKTQNTQQGTYPSAIDASPFDAEGNLIAGHPLTAERSQRPAKTQEEQIQEEIAQQRAEQLASRTMQQSPLGHEGLERDNYKDWLKKYRGNVFVGDASSNPFEQPQTGMNVGQKTQIDAPVQTQEDGARYGIQQATPRPGDYDYIDNPLPQASGRYTENSFKTVRTNVDIYNDQGYIINYTVRQDDSLSGISNKERVYGDWQMWPLIYDANRTQIKDPDLIYSGQQFDVPQNATDPQRTDARGRAVNKQAPYSFYDGR